MRNKLSRRAWRSMKVLHIALFLGVSISPVRATNWLLEIGIDVTKASDDISKASKLRAILQKNGLAIGSGISNADLSKAFVLAKDEDLWKIYVNLLEKHNKSLDDLKGVHSFLQPDGDLADLNRFLDFYREQSIQASKAKLGFLDEGAEVSSHGDQVAPQAAVAKSSDLLKTLTDDEKIALALKKAQTEHEVSLARLENDPLSEIASKLAANPILKKYSDDPQFTKSMGQWLKVNGQSPEALTESSRALQAARNGDIAEAMKLSGLTREQLDSYTIMQNDFLQNRGVVYGTQKWQPPQLTSGTPYPFKREYEGMLSFFNDPRKVFQRMQELEFDVVKEMARTGDSSDVVLQKLLTHRETIHGFKAAEIFPKGKSFSSTDWHAMLNKGSLFNDTTFDKGISEASRKSHGYLTHRIQWNVLMREMELSPETFGATSLQDMPSAPALLRTSGDSDLISASSGNGSWGRIFDEFSGKAATFNSPEYFHSQHTYFPGIGNWR